MASRETGKMFTETPMEESARRYADGVVRQAHKNKDPRGWKEFADQLAEHSAAGSAHTLRGIQKRRPSLFDLVDKIKTITAPTLIMTGDEDFGCLAPNIMMKKAIASAGLVVMPNCGHAINLEEPAMFNLHIEQFLHAVDVGAWRNRDPRAMAASILGK